MPTVEEAAEAQSPLKSGLVAGINTLSQNQEVTFTQYTRLILPADGFVFWVKTDTTFKAQGSLHYSGDQDQRQDETLGFSHVILTTKDPINNFLDVSPTTMWVGTFDGFKFSFNHKKNFYRQAGIYHYMGDAIYPAMASQLIEDATGFDDLSPVVSNSLPIWLSLNAKCDMYPSFLVDPNIVPPYAAVHIEPAQTVALQASPSFSSTLSHAQLASDMVLITTYGLRNAEALEFQDYLMQHSLDTDDFGVMNMPIMRDEKRTQTEFNILAQKKTIQFQVSYYQRQAEEIARQLILSAKITFYPQ